MNRNLYFKNDEFFRSCDGFTLVELMVVVAMIGVLSAIAIPNYQHFTARARQAEAKIALSAIYAAQQAFFGENGSYTYCLRQAGYVPEGAVRYYLVGASVYHQTLNVCGPQGNNDCRKYSFSTVSDCSSDYSGCCNALNLNGSDTTPGWPAPLTSSDIMYHSTVVADPNYKPFYSLFMGASAGGLNLDTHVTQNTFTFGAAGNIFPINSPNYWTSPVPSAMRDGGPMAHSSAAYDAWTIDEHKSLSNPYPGF